MDNLLQGLCLLNTRPKHQAQKLSLDIKKAGGRVVECPLLEIQAGDSSWTNLLPPLALVHMAIFISANAVDCCFKQLRQQNISWPNHIHVIAIGQATAKALQAYDITVHEIPVKSDSEDLVKLPSLSEIGNKNVLLFKGLGGRTVIEGHLKSKQAHLICLEVYQRVLPQVNQQFIQSIWLNDLVDIILITSKQSLENLFKLFGKDALSWLQSKPCLVISERIAKSASLLGMRHIIISSPNNILNTLRINSCLKKIPKSPSEKSHKHL